MSLWRVITTYTVYIFTDCLFWPPLKVKMRRGWWRCWNTCEQCGHVNVQDTVTSLMSNTWLQAHLWTWRLSVPAWFLQPTVLRVSVKKRCRWQFFQKDILSRNPCTPMSCVSYEPLVKDVTKPPMAVGTQLEKDMRNANPPRDPNERWLFFHLWSMFQLREAERMQ